MSENMECEECCGKKFTIDQARAERVCDGCGLVDRLRILVKCWVKCCFRVVDDMTDG